jgi:catechol 2,3-dioxygenase-like lactoylglutathione lyase family enzyme
MSFGGRASRALGQNRSNTEDRWEESDMRVNHLDHLVLTVEGIQASIAFYTRVLGMQETTFGGGRKGLVFGQSKINLHQVNHEFEPKAAKPTPGSGDLCLVVDDDLDSVQTQLAVAGVAVEVGPVEQTGAHGHMVSVYFRDPDRNLIELSNYISSNSPTAPS